MFDKTRTSYREFVHMRLAMLQKQLLDAVEAINKLKHLDKRSEEEKAKEVAALDKKCSILREKIAGMEAEDVNKEREATVIPIYQCDGCKKDIDPSVERRHCTECSNFDFCPSCWSEKGATHGHDMYPQTATLGELQKEVGRAKSFSECIGASFKAYAPRPCFGVRPPDPSNPGALLPAFQWLCYSQVWDRARSFGAALRSTLGVSPRDFVAISGPNSLEWFVADIACLAQSIVVVPIHYNLDPLTISKIVQNAEVSCAVIPRDLVPLYVKAHELGATPLRNLVVMAGTLEGLTSPPSLRLRLLSALEAEGAKTLSSFAVVPEEDADLITLVYTSGSTGEPKGAMITNGIWTRMVKEVISEKYDPLVSISKDPLAHISDREHVYGILFSGGRIGITHNISTVFEDIQLLSPNEVVATPRFWNVIYSDFKRAFNAESERLRASGVSDAHSLAALRRDLLAQFKTRLGKRLAAIGLGGAASSPVVVEWLRECYGPIVSDGYGSTEAGSIARQDGTLQAGVKFKIVDVPELSYFLTDKPYPRGELWVQSPTLIPGYYKNPTETAKAFTPDGWFKTGDIVQLEGENKVKIIDRVKNIFKLSQGEYVAPEKLETTYQESKFIDQVFITCADLRRFEQNNVLAVVVPNEEVVSKWCEDNNVSADARPAAVKQLLLADMLRIGANAGLRAYEIPLAIHVEHEKFTIANGRMTHSNKLARPVLDRFYRDTVNELCASLQAANAASASSAADTAGRLVALIAEVLGVPPARIDLDRGNLRDLGADSLAAMRLVNAIKDVLHVNVPMTLVVGPAASLSALRHFVEKPDSAPDGRTNHADLVKDSVPPEDLQWAGKPYKYRAAAAILLTGATGFLGAHLLKYLLLEAPPSASIYCLLRCDGNQDPFLRLQSSGAKFEIDLPDDLRSSKRVIAIRGDLGLPKFGLSDDLWSELAAKLDAIYHCGALVNHFLSYEDHRAANVGGTLTALRLSVAANKLKLLLFVSTTSVFSTGEMSRSELEDIDKENTAVLGGYAQSKWVAERLVRQAGARQLPVIIFRAGMVSWSNVTGAGNELDWLHRLLLGVIVLGGAPSASSSLLNLACVDYCARGIVHIGEVGAACSVAIGKVFHLTNTQRVYYSDVVKWMSEYGTAPDSPAASSSSPSVAPDSSTLAAPPPPPPPTSPISFAPPRPPLPLPPPAVLLHLRRLAQPLQHGLWWQELTKEIEDARANKRKDRQEALTGLLLFKTGVPTDGTMNCWQATSILSPAGIVPPVINRDLVHLFLAHLLRSGRLVTDLL